MNKVQAGPHAWFTFHAGKLPGSQACEHTGRQAGTQARMTGQHAGRPAGVGAHRQAPKHAGQATKQAGTHTGKPAGQKAG
jgi:hypothetical protein